ncbi:Polysaccharide pyruvyl transferase [Lachnospiraceae bacterium C10]|nr:Polysaccharide pyruvyl transferase [Lachnospiraceae bacterium C10]
MKKIGTVSFNIYCNFTNYGSALQTWALLNVIRKLDYEVKLIDYCPDILADKDPLNPFPNMWDQDEESRRNCELTLPAIRKNYYKFERFYSEVCPITKQRYTSANFNDVIKQEGIEGFVCGSDTIFCIEEFKGFDDGYYANYNCMKGKAVSYAASFGSGEFDENTYPILNARLKNFKALGIRENRMIDYVRSHCDVPCERTIDPTLLLTSVDYDTIAAERQYYDPYLLLYTRRYNPVMEEYAEKVAAEKGLKIVEISLRAANAEKGHIMRYDAGVEEFLSLVKYSDFVVTNSFHGLIFAVQYRRPMVTFSRLQAVNKIGELLELFGMEKSLLVTGKERYSEIDYEIVHQNIAVARKSSLEFLKMELGLL